MIKVVGFVGANMFLLNDRMSTREALQQCTCEHDRAAASGKVCPPYNTHDISNSAHHNTGQTAICHTTIP